jgi:two-component SAPR family response regulator
MKDRSNPKIYLVDDDPFYLDKCRQLLQGMGYQNIRDFLIPQECFDTLETEMPDIIFFDYEIMQPAETVLLNSIKAKYPSIKLVFLTGMIRTTDKAADL